MEARLLEESNLQIKEKMKTQAYEVEGSYTEEPPEIIYQDNTTSSIQFNVLPDSTVSEKLFIREYRVWDRYMEGVFDREYASQMAKSPDHLIFVSGLVHLQKMMYVYVVHKLGFDYDPHGPELVKFWPTDFKLSIRGLIRKKEDLVQKIFVEGIEKKERSGGYEIHGYSKVGNNLHIEGRCPFFIIGKRDQ